MFKKVFFTIQLCLITLVCLSAKAQNEQSQSVTDTVVKKELQYDDSKITPIQFEENLVEEYKKDDEFDYVEFDAPDNWWTRFNDWLSDLWNSFKRWLTGGKEVGGFLEFLIEALPYILILTLLIFFIWLFTKVDISGSPLLGKTPSKVILSDEQEIIENQNIEKLIAAAVEEKNYRLAVRYYYLLILQSLSKKEIIDWKNEKTNHDYIQEISEASLKKDFSNVTRIYDFIWYGSFAVDEIAFAKAEKEFKNLNSSI